MLIQKIKISNFKTYLSLDLDLTVDDDRPIILIGGSNGGGKTTLFEAISGALYGLKIESKEHFMELLNQGAINTVKPEIYQLAVDFLKTEIERTAAMGSKTLVLHPGSHVNAGVDAGIDSIIKGLNEVLTRDTPVNIALETMAGKGSEIGGRFEELRDILDAVGSENVGVCLDTCHVYDGGYDIVNDLDGVLAEFDRVIGLGRLHALHLNDSKNPFASHKDRHECLGKGSLGLETFRRIVNHPHLKDKPMILETPNELPGYAEEILILREMEA